MVSRHYTQDRQRREQAIQKIGYGEKYAEFIVDRHHPHGLERHVISTTGIIEVYAVRTNDLITKLIARPAQIERYFKKGEAPKAIVEIARRHQIEGLNEL